MKKGIVKEERREGKKEWGGVVKFLDIFEYQKSKAISI